MEILDLYSGAGGSSMGIHWAFPDAKITGVDINHQKNYPFNFVQEDALVYLSKYGHSYDLILASPPCQKFSTATGLNQKSTKKHFDLITPTRKLLEKIGVPYIIENVEGAPLRNPVRLCGTMFELLILRHRLFETSFDILEKPPECNHQRKVVDIGRMPDIQTQYISMVGHFVGVDIAREVTGIDWMTRDEMAQAILPHYTEWIGNQFKNRFSNYTGPSNCRRKESYI